MAGGDAQDYRLRLKAGEYCAIAVTQSAVDLVVTIDGPDGVEIAEVDTPHRTTGDEVVELVAARSGVHTLTVRVVEADAQPGSARVRVTTIRRASDADRRRVAARRVFERAEGERREGTAKSLVQAMSDYEQALALFRANGDHREIARALLGIAGVHDVRGNFSLAGPAYHQAADAFREAGDRIGEAEALSATPSKENTATALAVSRQAKDRTLEAMVLLRQAGSIYWERRYQDARALAEQATTIFEEVHNRWGYMRARRIIGIAVQDLETPKAALPIFEEVLAQARRLHDLEMEATALASIGWASVYLGDMEKALDAYSEAVEASRQSGSKLGEAWQTNALGQLYAMQGQPDRALAYYERALPLTRELGVTMDEGVALGSIGQVYSLLGDFEKGLDYWKQALELTQRTKDRQEEAVVLVNVGMVYERLGNGDDALEYYTRALQIQKELGNQRREGWTLETLGGFYANLGEYRMALDMNQQALDVSRRAGDGAGEVRALLNLADVRRLLGEPGRAIEGYEQALAVARGHGMKLDVSRTLVRLGYTYADQGDYDRARQYFSEALAIVRDGTTTAPGREAAALAGLGTTRRAAGDNAGSVQAFDEALAISRRLRDRGGEIGALNGLGQTLAGTSDYQRAIALYVEALRLARESRALASEGIALRNLMTAWRAAGRLELAVFYGKLAVNQLQTVRAGLLDLDPQTQRAYLRSKEQVYRELADLLITVGRLPEAQQVLDFLKGEEFREYVRRSSDAKPTGRVELTPEEAAEEQRYREIEGRLVTLGRQQSALALKRRRTAEETAELARIDSDLKIAAQHLQAFFASLVTELGANAGASERVFQLREAQGFMSDLRELGSGAVALYTIVGEQQYSVMLVTPEVQKAARYPIGSADLARKVLAFREALQDPRSDPLPLAQELYTILVGPVAKDLDQAHAQTLMWSLDGVLRYLPFSALHDGRQYMVERYRASVFTPASNPRLKDVPAPWRAGLGVGVSKPQPGFDALPDAARELRGIIRDPDSTDGSGVIRGRVLLDEAFTESALRAELGQQPPIVHVASHFQFRPGNEADSFLLLGDGRRLSVAELGKSWTFFKGVDLLTLSACDTAVGGAGASGKEVESFGVLAQRNGAKAVIASLWPVADSSTRLLMERFYRARTQSKAMTKAEALQAAQLALLRGESDAAPGSPRARSHRRTASAATGERDRPYSHPFYWAPFLLIGNWR